MLNNIHNNRRYLQHRWLYCATQPVSTFPPACSRRRLPSAALCEVYRVTIIRPGSLIKLVVVIAFWCLSIMHLRQYGIKNTNNPTKGRLLHQNAYSIHPFNCSPSIKPCLTALATTAIITQQHDCGMILRTEDTCTEKHCTAVMTWLGKLYRTKNYEICYSFIFLSYFFTSLMSHWWT